MHPKKVQKHPKGPRNKKKKSVSNAFRSKKKNKNNVSTKSYSPEFSNKRLTGSKKPSNP